MHETPSDLVGRPVITWRPARNERITVRALIKIIHSQSRSKWLWAQVPYLHAMTTNWETVTHEGETYKVLNDHAGNLTVTTSPGACAALQAGYIDHNFLSLLHPTWLLKPLG